MGSDRTEGCGLAGVLPVSANINSQHFWLTLPVSRSLDGRAASKVLHQDLLPPDPSGAATRLADDLPLRAALSVSDVRGFVAQQSVKTRRGGNVHPSEYGLRVG